MENTARSAGNSSAASMPVQPSLDGIASLAQPGTTPHSIGRSSNRVRTCSPAPFRLGRAPSVLLFSREHPPSSPWPSVWASQILPRRPSRIQMQSGTLETWARKNDTSCFSRPPYACGKHSSVLYSDARKGAAADRPRGVTAMLVFSATPVRRLCLCF